MKKDTRSYAEKLRDPRWQEKRLRILDDRGFICEFCHKKTETINVHHAYYEYGLDPWDYPDESLICLCDEHHIEWHKQWERLQKALLGPTPCASHGHFYQLLAEGLEAAGGYYEGNTKPTLLLINQICKDERLYRLVLSLVHNWDDTMNLDYDIRNLNAVD